MAKRKRENNDKQNERKTKEGRGKGNLADYKPWVEIQDIPSEGVCTRILGWKTGREHHLLSNLELEYFFLLEWSEQVIDIREQFPLDLDETIALSKNSNIAHPPKSNPVQPVVMTTDFLITVRLPIGTKEFARTIKYSKDLNSRRVLEKLEIERQYWMRRNISWGIVTELDINSVFSNNIKTIHPLFEVRRNYPEISSSIIDMAEKTMVSCIDQKLPICEIAKICDKKLSLKPGMSLGIAQHLIATRKWQIDLTHPYPFEVITPLTLRNEGGAT